MKEVQSCGVYLVSDRFDCAAKMIVRRNSVGTGGVLFPGTAMVKKRHITSLFLPNDCGQARKGEAPELSVPTGSAFFLRLSWWVWRMSTTSFVCASDSSVIDRPIRSDFSKQR